MTEWPRFLAGHRLDAATRLIDLPYRPTPPPPQREQQSLHRPPRPGGAGGGDTSTNPILCNLLDAFDRNIGRARESLAAGKLSVFDQHRLNSFIPRRSSPKPLYHRLQKGTYTKYMHVFQRLICFVYRLAWVKLQSAPLLHDRLTDELTLALANAVRTARELAEAEADGGETKKEDVVNGRIRDGSYGYYISLRKRADDACLALCISLLDHQLYGDIYDSLVVGFLAVLPIEEFCDGKPLPRPRLCEAIRYTSHLLTVYLLTVYLRSGSTSAKPHTNPRATGIISAKRIPAKRSILTSYI